MLREIHPSTVRRLLLPLVAAVIGSGCSSNDEHVPSETTEFSSTTCEGLAREYGSYVQDRSFAAIEDQDRDPFFVSRDVTDTMLVAFKALTEHQRLGCVVDDFMAAVDETLSDRFKEEVPRWLSSENVGNDWAQYRLILVDYVNGAFQGR